jgi:predicted PurR-regulated permease PerM
MPVHHHKTNRLRKKYQNLPAQNISRAKNTVINPWGNTTKLVVSFTFMALLAGVVIRFNTLLGPILLSLILSYLMYPFADTIRKKLNISWKLTVSILYILILLIVLGLLIWGGIALVEQVQSLIRFIQNALTDLPKFIKDISSKPLIFGPFEIDLSETDLISVANQTLSTIQPFFSQIGSAVGGIATSAAVTLGWLFFVLVFSYFVVVETHGIPERFLEFQLPGQSNDFLKLGNQLARIWNAFLRGQIIIILLTVVIYTVLLGGLQIRFYFGLAILAGFARLVPYIGPTIAWTTYGLVAFFQGVTIFGLTPFGYALVVIGSAIVMDTLLDNLVVTRVLADTLKVHPAAIMVAVLMAASILGIIGILLAAPVLATVKLIATYALRKLFDQDPWMGMDTSPPAPSIPSISDLKNSVHHMATEIIKRLHRIVPDLRK